jgi:serine/threonine-protein kinase/endoribonuclease IRE1
MVRSAFDDEKPETLKDFYLAEFIHVTSSTSGKIVTMNRKTGGFLWEKLDVKSPIVAIFLLGPDGFLSVPFTTVADDIIRKVVDYSKNDETTDFKL